MNTTNTPRMARYERGQYREDSQDSVAENTGHEAALRGVEEEAEIYQGEEERPYRREEDEVNLVPDGGGEEVMAGVVSAR